MRAARTWLTLCCAFALGMVTACGGEAESRPGAPLERASGTSIEQAMAGMYSFAEAYAEAAAADSENIVYSPMSLAYAFAMLRAGAAGATADQLDEVFGFPSDGLHQVFADMARQIATTDAAPPPAEPGSTRPADEPPADPIVAIANGLFVQNGVALGAEFLRTLDDAYGAIPQEVNFAGGQAKETIDAWVAEQTADRITELFDDLDPDTVAVLANAVYLKAEWEHQFQQANTRDESFRLADGNTVDVPMMNLRDQELNYLDGDGWQAVELPYAGGELAMWVVIPDNASIRPGVNADMLRTLAAGGQRTSLTLAMPRWDFTAQAPLLPLLAELGVTNLHELPGIAPAFSVSDAIHQANITVDEHGTEAAAVTGIAGVTSLAPQPELEIRADHPFSFAVLHTPTGAPLFLGNVADPSTQ